MNILTTLIPALLPAFADGLRGIFARLTGGKAAQPQTVEQAIAMMNAETERFKVLADIDRPTGEVYKWVSSVRALQRPAIMTIILAIYAAALYVKAPDGVVLTLGDYVGMAMFYLFGDKSYSLATRGRKS